MGKWTDLARQLSESEPACANSSNSANSSDISPIGTIGTNGTGATALPILPTELRAGLDRLRAGPPPRIVRQAIWAEIASDALRLSSEGWATKALALGWHPLELFGATPLAGGDERLEGLAVWLGGRRVLLIDERTAIAAEGRSRSIYHRKAHDGAAFLWDLADIQRNRNRGAR